MISDVADRTESLSSIKRTFLDSLMACKEFVMFSVFRFLVSTHSSSTFSKCLDAIGVRG